MGKYPGIPTTADGSEVVVWVETHISQGACAYPITPSTNMGQGYEAAVANGQKNLWGEPLHFLELESEHSSASSCEGFALAGGRVTNFTCGQGLVLMKEVLYTISGKRLPVVFHIGARSLTSHSLSIHAGHDDVMSVADTGWGILFGKNAQEACDLALIARRTAEKSLTPFMNVQDGFLTTHTIENVLLPEPDLMKEYISEGHLHNFMDTSNPLMTGIVQNQESYMKGKISQRYFYNEISEILKKSMKEFGNLSGRHYEAVQAYRLEDAEYAIVGMGSAMETAMAAVDFIRKKSRLKVGVLNVTSFRPFPSQEIVAHLKNVKSISVIERVDIPLMQSNPLTCEIKAAFSDAATEIQNYPKIYSGVYGLGGKNISPSDFLSIVHHMKTKQQKKYFFCIGIDHEDALPQEKNIDCRPKNSFAMRGHSIGGFGSVTTNKILATLIADLFHLHVQAFPKYGSEKRGLPTQYFLTISPTSIKTHCELNQVDFVALNDVNAFGFGNPLEGLSGHGIIFVQTSETDPKKIWNQIPITHQKYIQENKIRIFGLDTLKIAKESSNRPELIQRMQGIVLLGIFLKISPVVKQFNISQDALFSGVQKSIQKYFGKKGEQVVNDNLRCVEKGYQDVFEVSH